MLSLRFPLDICEDSELVCEPEVKLSLYLVVVNVEVVFKIVSFFCFVFFLEEEEDQRLSSGHSNG